MTVNYPRNDNSEFQGFIIIITVLVFSFDKCVTWVSGYLAGWLAGVTRPSLERCYYCIEVQ